MKDKVGEAESLALELRLTDYRTAGVLARRRRRKHVDETAEGEKILRFTRRTAASATRLNRCEATLCRPQQLLDRHSRLYSPLMRLSSHLVRVVSALAIVPIITNAVFAQAGDSLRSKLEQRIGATPGAVVGLYYKSLQSGELVTIQPDSSFHAASTMKVPVMIEFFRQVERN